MEKIFTWGLSVVKARSGSRRGSQTRTGSGANLFFVPYDVARGGRRGIGSGRASVVDGLLGTCQHNKIFEYCNSPGVI